MKRQTNPRERPVSPLLPYPQTPVTAAAYIRAHGISVAGLARTAGVKRLVLVDLLRGQLRGYRGEAHKGAIVLGLKADPTQLKPSAKEAA